MDLKAIAEICSIVIAVLGVLATIGSLLFYIGYRISSLENKDTW